MLSTALTAETFERAVAAPGIVLVCWWADWSGPCRKFGAVFEQASQAHSDLMFTTVDTLAEPGLAVAMQVTAVPDVMVYRDGVLVYEEAAMLSAAELDAVIAATRAVDMTAVARRLDARASS
jgi:thioredoxin 1